MTVVEDQSIGRKPAVEMTGASLIRRHLVGAQSSRCAQSPRTYSVISSALSRLDALSHPEHTRSSRRRSVVSMRSVTPNILGHLDRNTRSVCSGEIYACKHWDFSAPWLRHCGRNDRVVGHLDAHSVISTALS